MTDSIGRWWQVASWCWICVIWPMIMSVMGTVLFDEPYVKEFPLAVRSTSHVLSTHDPPPNHPLCPVAIWCLIARGCMLVWRR
eukprot:COSAG01_NODE_1925_length_8884_cov_6.366648_9_plen_83_part_00